MMPELAEVFPPQPEQRGAVELGVPAHPVVGMRMQVLPVRVPPVLLGLVLPLHVDRPRTPVVRLPRHIVATLEQQDPLAGGRQPVEQGAAPRAGPDDDDVVV